MRKLWVALILLTCCGAALQSAGSRLEPPVDVVDVLGVRLVDVAAGEWWRLLSAPFVSSNGWPHALLNVAGLVLVGRAVERAAGWRALAVTFAAGALAGFAAGVHGHGIVWLAAGGSGGVLACAGFLLARRVAVQPAMAVVAATFLPPLLLGWWFEVFRRGSWPAHLGGLVAGAVVGLGAGPRPRPSPATGARRASLPAAPAASDPRQQDVRTRLVFVNDTGAPMRVYWVTYRRRIVYSAMVMPEPSLRRNRVPFYGHAGAAYIVTDAEDRCVLEVVARREPGELHVEA